MSHHVPSSRSSIVTTFVAAAACALALSSLAGCGSDKTEPTKDTKPSGAQTAQSIGAAPGASTPAAITPGGAAAPGGTTTPAPGAGLPAGRSGVPTQDEWAAAKEVGVKGSTKLNCETKMVREWLRVSCRGKNDTGGEAKSVTIKKGGGKGDTFTFASGGVASLICPFVDGTDLVAEFTWSDKKQELVVSWPHGAPMPPMKGEFR